MKKILAILAMFSASSVFAAGWASLDVESVKGRAGAKDSMAQYVRAGTEIGGIAWGIQSRTARVETGDKLFNSFELTGGKSLGIVTPFVGMGHDNGLNGSKPYNYGLVGATTGLKLGPGYTLLGVKTRVGSTETVATKQTIWFSTYSIPVTKTVSVNLNASRSNQHIKENAFGAGLSFKF